MRRDDITAEQRTQIALAVLSPDRVYGRIRALADQYDLSRESIYKIAERAEEVLQAGMQPRQHGSQAKVKTIVVEGPRVVRSIGQLAVSGVSQRDTVACLEEILDTKVSLGWVNARLSELERAAGVWNEQQSPSIGESLSGDELYANGLPNLLVVGNDSLYIYHLSQETHCDAETWTAILQALPEHPQFASDAGTGLAAGAKAADITVHQLDWDHLLRPLWGHYTQLEKQAYATLTALDEREQQFDQAYTEKRLQNHLAQWEKQRQEAEVMMARLDTFEQWAQQVDESFALVDPETGHFPDGQTLIEKLQVVGEQMGHWSARIYQKLASNLTHWAHKLFSYQPLLQEAFSPLLLRYGHLAVHALSAIWQIEAHEKRQQPTLIQQQALQALWEKHLDIAVEHLGEERLWEAWQAISTLLGRSWRGSMLAECVNSLLRPCLKARQHTDQGCLELFRFFHNLRPFQRGKRKGYSPAQLVDLDTPDDPFSLLGLPSKVSI
jgi:hypothetical protein